MRDHTTPDKTPTSKSGHRDTAAMIAALFSYQFVDGGVEYDALEQIHRGDIHDWVAALESAGLFCDALVADIEKAWTTNPKLLIDILLSEADEMTTRRCRITWAALDRLAPLAQLG